MELNFRNNSARREKSPDSVELECDNSYQSSARSESVLVSDDKEPIDSPKLIDELDLLSKASLSNRQLIKPRSSSESSVLSEWSNELLGDESS